VITPRALRRIYGLKFSASKREIYSAMNNALETVSNILE
jgi:hypothetical protein